MATQVIPITIAAINRVFLVKGEAGTVLVDASIAGQADRILAAMREHGVAPEDVRLILITHGHADHTGSARELRERTGAPIAIHAADAEDLRSGGGDLTDMEFARLWVKMAARLMSRFASSSSSQTPLEPDIVFGEAWRLDEYGVAGEVLPTPGHSPGSSSLLLDSGEAIIGDILMAGLLRPAHPTPPMLAWDMARNWESVRAVLAREPTVLYIAHGKPLDPAAVEALVQRQTA